MRSPSKPPATQATSILRLVNFSVRFVHNHNAVIRYIVSISCEVVINFIFHTIVPISGFCSLLFSCTEDRTRFQFLFGFRTKLKIVERTKCSVFDCQTQSNSIEQLCSQLGFSNLAENPRKWKLLFLIPQ